MSTTVKLNKLKAGIDRVSETSKDDNPDLFRDRIRYIETCLAELVEEAGKHHAELIARIEFASSSEAQRAAIMAEKLQKVQKDIQELELLVYGEPKYLMPGLAKQIYAISESLEMLKDEREAQVNQIKGMKLAVTALGVTGVGTLIGVLTQLFGG